MFYLILFLVIWNRNSYNNVCRRQNSTKSSSAPSDPSAVVEHTRHLLSISLADSTKKMYGVGWRSYVQYCSTANRKPLPLSEEALMNWASSTALSGCKYTTIKSYLSCIRSARSE